MAPIITWWNAQSPGHGRDAWSASAGARPSQPNGWSFPPTSRRRKLQICIGWQGASWMILDWLTRTVYTFAFLDDLMHDVTYYNIYIYQIISSLLYIINGCIYIKTYKWYPNYYLGNKQNIIYPQFKLLWESIWSTNFRVVRLWVNVLKWRLSESTGSTGWRTRDSLPLLLL